MGKLTYRIATKPMRSGYPPPPFDYVLKAIPSRQHLMALPAMKGGHLLVLMAANKPVGCRLIRGENGHG